MPHLTQSPTPSTPQRTPGASLTEGEKQRFYEALDRTQRVKEAAQDIGISLPTAYQLLKEQGWASPRTGPSAACGKPKKRYTQEQKDEFFAAFEKHQNVSQAAREVNMPIHTCYQWAVKAGLKILKPHAGKLEEFLRLRAQGMPRKEATELVGIHERTAHDWDNGVKHINNTRIFPDGRVVDYNSGMTTDTTESGRQQSTANPSILALDKQIDPRYLSIMEREEIYALNVAGHSIRQIATKLNRSPSNIQHSTGNCDETARLGAITILMLRTGRP